MSGHPHPSAVPAKAALEHVAHAELAADPPDVDRLSVVLKARVARDDEQLGESRQLGDDVLGDPVTDVVLIRIRRQILERQHRDRRSVGQRERRPRQPSRIGGGWRRRSLLPHVRHEAEPLTRQRPDHVLALSVVADGGTHRVDASGERRVRDRPPAPDRGHELVLADDSLAVAQQIIEEVEHLRRQRHQGVVVP
jgi:hypothetical protein